MDIGLNFKLENKDREKIFSKESMVELCDKVNYNDLINFLNQNKMFLSMTNKFYRSLRHNYLRISARKKKEFCFN